MFRPNYRLQTNSHTATVTDEKPTRFSIIRNHRLEQYLRSTHEASQHINQHRKQQPIQQLHRDFQKFQIQFTDSTATSRCSQNQWTKHICGSCLVIRFHVNNHCMRPPSLQDLRFWPPAPFRSPTGWLLAIARSTHQTYKLHPRLFRHFYPW